MAGENPYLNMSLDELKQRRSDLLKKKVKPGVSFEGMSDYTKSVIENAPSSFTITSGYRDVDKNRDVGGVPGSMHTKGQGFDIRLNEVDEDLLNYFDKSGFRSVKESDHYHFEPKRGFSEDDLMGKSLDELKSMREQISGESIQQPKTFVKKEASPGDAILSLLPKRTARALKKAVSPKDIALTPEDYLSLASPLLVSEVPTALRQFANVGTMGGSEAVSAGLASLAKKSLGQEAPLLESVKETYSGMQDQLKKQQQEDQISNLLGTVAGFAAPMTAAAKTYGYAQKGAQKILGPGLKAKLAGGAAAGALIPIEEQKGDISPGEIAFGATTGLAGEALLPLTRAAKDIAKPYFKSLQFLENLDQSKINKLKDQATEASKKLEQLPIKSRAKTGSSIQEATKKLRLDMGDFYRDNFYPVIEEFGDVVVAPNKLIKKIDDILSRGRVTEKGADKYLEHLGFVSKKTFVKPKSTPSDVSSFYDDLLILREDLSKGISIADFDNIVRNLQSKASFTGIRPTSAQRQYGSFSRDARLALLDEMEKSLPEQAVNQFKAAKNTFAKLSPYAEELEKLSRKSVEKTADTLTNLGGSKLGKLYDEVPEMQEQIREAVLGKIVGGDPGYKALKNRINQFEPDTLQKIVGKEDYNNLIDILGKMQQGADAAYLIRNKPSSNKLDALNYLFRAIGPSMINLTSQAEEQNMRRK